MISYVVFKQYMFLISDIHFLLSVTCEIYEIAYILFIDLILIKHCVLGHRFSVHGWLIIVSALFDNFFTHGNVTITAGKIHQI